jgi:hypothetical protein
MVGATWISYDRAQIDPIHVDFCKASAAKTARCVRYAVAASSSVRDLGRSTITKVGETFKGLCAISDSAGGPKADPHACALKR